MTAFLVLKGAGRKQLLTWVQLGYGQSTGHTHPYTSVDKTLRALRSSPSPSGQSWSDLDQFIKATRKGIHFLQPWYEVQDT